jgi:hypothetical protein
MKKIKKSTLRNKADSLFSKFIRSRGYCQAEGKTMTKCGGVLQCCHVTTRSVTALRYDEMNVLCMCAGHHRFFTNHPLEWAEFLLEHYPENHTYVMVHKNDVIKKTEDLYRSVIESYGGR